MTYEPIEYLYKPILRPVSFASLPHDIQWDYVEAPANEPLIAQRRGIPLSRYPFGIIAVNREFTADEREHYGMVRV